MFKKQDQEAMTKLVMEIYSSPTGDTATRVPSEMFEQSYCIFIDRNTAEKFNNAIAKLGLKDKNVKVLKGTWSPDATACIVIPKTLDYNPIEEALFKLPEAKLGFWGQQGMGYKGKTWEVV